MEKCDTEGDEEKAAIKEEEEEEAAALLLNGKVGLGFGSEKHSRVTDRQLEEREGERGDGSKGE